MGVEGFRDVVKKVSIVIEDVVWEVVFCCCLKAGSY